MLIVSSCLVGVNCRYNGSNCLNNKVQDLVANGSAIAVCPEQLGGCCTPREPSEIIGGSGKHVLAGFAKVITKSGKDVTNNFIKGAEETLKIAKLTNATKAILKSKSPSCGCGYIYDGTFNNNLIQGNGVTTSLLLMNNIKVVTDCDVD